MAIDSGAPGSIKSGQRVGHPVQHLEPVELKRGRRYDRACESFEDFLQSSSGTLVAPWATQDTSAAGSPTLDFVDDADNGTYTLAHDNTDEAQNLTLYWGDSLHIDATSKPIFEAKVTITSATPSADQRAVFGLAAARNATLDSNAGHAWFRWEGANNNILYESDDGTTDDDDNDSDVDWTSGTAFVVRIDMRTLGQVAFYVDGALVGVTSAAALTGNLQPYFELQKDGGTETDSITIDYCHVTWDR